MNIALGELATAWIGWEWTFWITVITIAGLMIGSFLNVVIYRLPLGENLSKPRSKCPGCGQMIRWYDNIPVVSWVLLRARCRNCSTRISLRYPMVELLCGVCFFFAARAWLPDFATTAVCCIALALLIAISYIDWDHKLILDRLSYPAIVFALATAPFVALRGSEASWFDDAPQYLNALLDSAIGAAIGYGVIYVIRFIGSAILRKEAMGLGDAKLLAFIGALVGPMYVMYALVLACLGGAVLGGIMFLVGKARPLALGLTIRRDDTEASYTRAYVRGTSLFLVDPTPFERGDRVKLEMTLAASKILEDEDATFQVGGRVAKDAEAHVGGRTRIDLTKLDELSQERVETFALSYKYIPFGPFLSLGGAIMALWGAPVAHFIREDYPRWLHGLGS